MSVDGDTGSFLCYINSCFYPGRVLLRFLGGDSPQHLSWIPLHFFLVINVTSFFFTAVLSVEVGGYACCSSFLSPWLRLSGQLPSQQLLFSGYGVPEHWLLGHLWALKNTDMVLREGLVTGVAIQQPTEDNSPGKILSSRVCPANQESLACSKLRQGMSQSKGSYTAPIALSFKPGVTGAEDRNLMQLGGARWRLLPDN